jgi:hypothetical protein
MPLKMRGLTGILDGLVEAGDLAADSIVMVHGV